MKTKDTQTISVWIDRIGDPEDPQIIVSLDDADTSHTLAMYDLRAGVAARDYAIEEAKNRGLSVVEETPDQSGQWETIFESAQ